MEDNNDYLDEKKIATKTVEEALGRILKFSESKVKSKIAKLNAKKKKFEKYVNNKYRHINNIKNIMHRKDSVHLSNIYVNLNVRKNGELIKSNDIYEILINKNKFRLNRESPALLITGDAGSGKTTVSKQIFNQIVDKQLPYVPIHITVNNLNSLKEFDSMSAICGELAEFGLEISTELAELCLITGLFVVILDGYDELNFHNIKMYKKMVDQFSIKFQKTPLIVTSRYRSDFNSWTFFDHMEFDSINIEKMEEIVNRFRYDLLKQEKYIEVVKEKEREFLKYMKTPLYIMISFLSYCRTGEINFDSVEFYQDAFDTLWVMHDDTKNEFIRSKYTNLSRAEFEKFLSAFCFYSLAGPPGTFDQRSANEYVKRANKRVKMNLKTNEFLEDMCTGINLFVVDDFGGMKFFHNSMLEYFAALFVIHLDSELYVKAIQTYVRQKRKKIVDIIKRKNAERYEEIYVRSQLSKFVDMLRNEIDAAKEYKDIENIYLQEESLLVRQEIGERASIKTLFRRIEKKETVYARNERYTKKDLESDVMKIFEEDIAIFGSYIRKIDKKIEEKEKDIYYALRE